MNARIKITRKQAAPIIAKSFPDYKGRKISVEFTDKVNFYDTNWSGGTCNKYAFLKASGESMNFLAPAPWANPVEGKTVELPADIIVVKHSYFCGSDCGLTIYAHPSYAPKFLNA